MSERGPLEAKFTKKTNKQPIPTAQLSEGPLCPECGSRRVWKDGLRYTSVGAIQRYICRECGYRFSESPMEKPRKIALYKTTNCRVGGWDDQPKNSAKAVLALRDIVKKKAVGTREPTETAEIKGKIVEFLWEAEKEGLAHETIRGYRSCLKALIDRGANLFDPESVKEVLAKEKRWSPNRRRNVINTYTKFLRFLGLSWDKPKCKVPKKLPSFIPMESEIDTLIAGSNKKLACFLQIIKETGMRAGEAFRLKWTDIDFERRLIVLNEPEKGSNPRVWKISNKLVEMLKSLPRHGERVFPNKTLASLKDTFLRTRKRLANKLQNPRLLRITFHIIRHWKATMEYHKTKDILYVKNLLGHKKIENTEIYITLERAIFGEGSDSEYHVKVAKTPDEIKALLEVGFEYICEKDGLLFFRKRK
ncbi:site-specific integrase [Candidatus Bathyarchaeota archaeon]|nr:site-specific integrase [Candidatus Bathyarchaeota archaeon]